ncbi:MAG: DpnD/PcfM family protein, partial [Rickettsiales bacterium]|nr:DpnD/PcfM family protein [Rickettsiales bacterium]
IGQKKEVKGHMIFNVMITETRSKRVKIEAETEDEAISRVEKKYLGGEIVLGSDDFENANYMVEP